MPCGNAYTQLFAALQRGKVLECFTVLDGHSVLSIDGTGYFSSKKVHCERCCQTQHRDGSVTYRHQMLGAVLVHPVQRAVFALAPEMIRRQDGASKNDCERNAAKRLVADFRRQHPHLRTIVVQDGLFSTAPHIALLKELDLRFIITAKPGDHNVLFAHVEGSDAVEHRQVVDTDARRFHDFRWCNDVPLNASHGECRVNFLACRQTDTRRGKVTVFTWVTDIDITADNVTELMNVGRSRWRIENELFTTLQRHGYQFEHNFGHGRQHLSALFATLAMLAFLIDQIQARCCALFRAMHRRYASNRALWNRLGNSG